jgi:hypothetical protein
VHADGVGDGFEIERPQVLHAVAEESVLLTHDLGRYFQNGFRALIERSDQPGRALQTVGEISLVLIALRRLGDLGVVDLVHQHLGQRVGIELDDETAVGRGAHEHVRDDRLHQRGSEGEPGLRVELADLGDHVAQVFLAHAAELAQGGEIAPGQKVEMRDERLHRGIEAVALLELKREAFVEIARADPRRIETLQDRQHGFDLGLRGTQPLSDEREVAAEIAGLVDQIDEILPDHTARG